MKNNIKKKTIIIAIVVFAIIAFLVFMLVYNGVKDHQLDRHYYISKNQSTEEVIIDASLENLQDFDIEIGDTVNVRFSNKYIKEDVPLLSGNYVNGGFFYLTTCKTENGLLESTDAWNPSNSLTDSTNTANNANNQKLTFGCFGINNLWTVSGFQTGDTVSISLNTKGKYKVFNDTLSKTYSDDITEYENAEQFCNYRPLSAGNIKENMFFRGASVSNNKQKRCIPVNDFIKRDNIQYIIDLPDSNAQIESNIQQYNLENTYFTYEYAQTNKRCIDAAEIRSVNIKDPDFDSKFISVLLKIAKLDGNVYIQCLDGNEQTGFSCALIEGIAGASYSEIVEDYMKTYENYYGLTQDKNPEEYNAIKMYKLDKFLHQITKTEESFDMQNCDFSYYVEMYLRGNGVGTQDIDKIKNRFSK